MVKLMAMFEAERIQLEALETTKRILGFHHTLTLTVFLQ